MKNLFKRISVIIFCTILCSITVFANPMINAPFNPFDPVDELTAAATEIMQTTTDAITTTETVIPTTTDPPVPALIPVKVKETDDNGVRKIIKTYELTAKENPEHISKNNFELNGWEYTLSDITKKETVDTKTKEYSTVIDFIPDTDDVKAIINVLDKTMNYTSGDGYSGTLKLIENSVKAEITGTKLVPFTLSETRQYDNFSSNDSSYIPKSISDKYNRILTLSNLEWRSNSSVYIDNDSFADSYTAVATYTGTGYRNVVMGYAGNAEYSGTLTKNVPGKTIYTAVFTGTEIPPPTTSPAEPETELTTENPTTTEEPTTEEITEEPEPEPEPFNPVPVAVAGSAGGAGLLGGLIFFFLKMKNVKVCNYQNGSYIQIGKTRVGYKAPTIDLTPFSQIAESTNYTLIIGRFATWRLSNKSVKINYGDKSLDHIVNSDGFKEYQFDVRF